MKTSILLIGMALNYSFIAFANNEGSEKKVPGSDYKSNPFHANGSNYLSFGLEIGLTLNNSSLGYSMHYGLPVKVYFGNQKKGRFILRTGVHYFPVPFNKLEPSVNSINKTIIPLAGGYRQNIQDWYVEGSLGISASMSSVKFADPDLSPSKSSFREINYGLEVGRQLGNFDIGLAVYNTGPIPFNMVFAGFKGSYRIKW